MTPNALVQVLFPPAVPPAALALLLPMMALLLVALLLPMMALLLVALLLPMMALLLEIMVALLLETSMARLLPLPSLLPLPRLLPILIPSLVQSTHHHRGLGSREMGSRDRTGGRPQCLHQHQCKQEVKPPSPLRVGTVMQSLSRAPEDVTGIIPGGVGEGQRAPHQGLCMRGEAHECRWMPSCRESRHVALPSGDARLVCELDKTGTACFVNSAACI